MILLRVEVEEVEALLSWGTGCNLLCSSSFLATDVTLPVNKALWSTEVVRSLRTFLVKSILPKILGLMLARLEIWAHGDSIALSQGFNR